MKGNQDMKLFWALAKLTEKIAYIKPRILIVELSLQNQSFRNVLIIFWNQLEPADTMFKKLAFALTLWLYTESKAELKFFLYVMTYIFKILIICLYEIRVLSQDGR